MDPAGAAGRQVGGEEGGGGEDERHRIPILQGGPG